MRSRRSAPQLPGPPPGKRAGPPGPRPRRRTDRHHRLGLVALQALGDHAQVGQELRRAGVRVLWRHRMAQRLGAGQVLQGGGQAGVHAHQGAAVGLVLAVGVLVGRRVGQRCHRRRHAGQHLADRQLGAQRMHLGQVEAQCHLALPRQGHAQRVGRDIGVAVAVAADPLAHAQEAGHRKAGQVLLDLGVQLGDLAQEGALVVAQRVLDLVGHRQLGVAQHARLPQLGDAGAHQRLVGAAFTLGGQLVARAHQFGDRPLGIQDALALHLGGVGRQHRADVGLRQHLRHVGRADVGLVQALEAQRQAAVLLVALALMVLPAAHVLAVFGDVGQVAEVAEGADHAHRLVGRQVLQQPVEHPASRRVFLQPVGHAQLAHPLDQLEGFLALLLADHIAQQPAQ